MIQTSRHWLLGVILGISFAMFAIGNASGDGRKANGVSCNSDSECESGYCTSNKCKGKNDKVANGVACRSDSDCESGYCTSNKCKGKSGKVANGVACKSDSECESGYCSSNVCKKP